MNTETVARSRMDDWGDYLARLSLMRRYTKKELKVFEAYFVKGKEPREEIGHDPIPLVYRLWLAQDQSDSGWGNVLSHVLNFSESVIRDSLESSRKIFYQDAISPCFGGLDGSPLGCFGGAEERLFNFFVTHVDNQGERLLGNANWGYDSYRDLLPWMQGKSFANPYVLYRYMQDYWVEKIMDDRYVERFDSMDNMCVILSEYFSMIKKIVAEGSSPIDGLHVYAVDIFERVYSLRLKGKIASLWAEA